MNVCIRAYFNAADIALFDALSAVSDASPRVVAVTLSPAGP
jgi:hypothetical protein